MPRRKTLTIDRLPNWIGYPEKVTKGDLAKYRNLDGVETEMARRYPSGWGDEELTAFIIEKRQETLRATLDEHNSRKAVTERQEAHVEELVQRYLDTFADPTPNDMVGLREMARIQLTLDLVGARLAELAVEKKPDANSVKILAQVRKDALASFQSLEKSLGIDRESRHQESDAVSMFEDLKRRARALLDKRRVWIVCPNCNTNLGFIVFHFSQNDGSYMFQTTCPRAECGHVVEILKNVSENLF